MSVQAEAPDAAPAPRAVVIGAGRSKMTDEALAQLEAAASLRGCVRAVGMPDLHPGQGIPVGAAFAMIEGAYPHLVGSDAGCGARVVCTALHRISRDRVERRLRAAFSKPGPLLRELDERGRAALFEAVWFEGPRGLGVVPGLPDLLRELCQAEPAEEGLPKSGPPSSYDRSASRLLGTIGGGNHFAELGLVQTLADSAVAGRLGLVKGAITVLVHSGSRGLGHQLGTRWGRRMLGGDELALYLGELAGACRFARTNRLVLAHALLDAVGVTQLRDVRGGFDIIHNDIRLEPLGREQVWVHRKGAAPAHLGCPSVVLGSRGAPSWIMVGHGSEHALRSIAHGAGRRMSRREARSRLEGRYRRKELSRSAIGSRLLCDDPALLYEEHPDAYKPIEPVVAALEDAGAASRVASVVPVITVKL